MRWLGDGNMKNKKIFLIIAILVIFALVIGCIIFMSKNKSNDNKEIPNGYISVFHGGSGEITYETYIYKQKNGHDNYGFDYINVTNTTKSWGSTEWDSRITKRGSVKWTDEVFKVAKENGAYSYVTLPKSSKTYTIEEYQSMFLKN